MSDQMTTGASNPYPLPGSVGLPEFDHASMSSEEASFSDYVDGVGYPDRTEEYADHDPEVQRFDEPSDDEFRAAFPESPISVQRRGLTSHASTTAQNPPGFRGNDRSNLKPKLWQSEFWAVQTAFKHSVAAKVREAGRPDIADGLVDCHSTFTVAQCGDCGAVRRFPNRCDNFYCPECQPRLAGERRKAVEWWTNLVSQPKHVVLTVKNIPNLARGHVQEFKRWFARLRRRAFCVKRTYIWEEAQAGKFDGDGRPLPPLRTKLTAPRARTATGHTITSTPWRGGFYSLEVTNDGDGWHLHLHALVDADWIDQQQLSIEWSAVNGGCGYITYVKDARRESYMAELVKYAVKGSDLAKWSGRDIVTFIDAFSTVRAFGVFGALYGARTKFAEFIASIRDAKPLCDCGSCNIHYFSEHDWLVKQHVSSGPAAARPPSSPSATPDMFHDQQSSQHSAAAIAR